MTTYTVFLEQLPALFSEWSKKYALYVPTEVQDQFYDFTRWDEDTELAWDYDVAYNSIKRFVLPPKETLITFNTEDYTAKPHFEAPEQLLFGVHPYDLKGLNQLDQLMEAGSPDQNYRRRRDNTVVMAMEPLRIAEEAFWGTVGSYRAEHGFDLYWTKISPSSFVVEVGSVLGEELLCLNGTPYTSTVAEKEAVRRSRLRVLREARKKGLKYNWEETPRVLAKSWDSPLWRKYSQMCLACGSCNVVCPTCYCFDMKEEVDDLLKEGVRYREWDGCMLESFAKVAGDHNFRPKSLERYRHRYFRKGKYIYDKIGELGCIGCGRCVRACTANIANPEKVFNELWEESENEY
ncbi:MAG: 4Fe-4S dicluster domain-containing protein [Desulfovibrio sp.]